MPVSFNDLYPKQKKVIMHQSGPLLVLAGPGTGKTEVLTHRIAYLVNNGKARPEEILAVTFSRKAASEMAERLKNFEGFEKAQPRTSTLHAEALRILSGIGSNNRFLLNDDETKLLMMDTAEDLGLNLGARELGKLERAIGLLKANNKLPKDISCMDSQTKRLKDLYERYEQLLDFNRAIDMDGLIVKVVRALPSGGHSQELKIRHLLVDEYQDINQAQFTLIQILAENIESLFAVGDDDQSIYGWRGADPSIMRSFRQHFKGAQVETLEESYRCTGHILKGAQAIVARDPNYINKPLKSVKGDGSLIHVLFSKSWTVEALWVAEWIKDSVSKNLVRPCDIVILCKDLKLADDVAAQLRRMKIDTTYWRPGGLFADKTVRDILAHIRLLVNKEDNLALRRCTETATGRGIGKIGMLRIRRIAEKHECSFWSVFANADEYGKLLRWQGHLKSFVMKIKELENKSSKLKLDETIHLIAKEIGVSGLSRVDKLKDFAKSLPTEADLEDLLVEVHKNRGLDLAGGVPGPEEQKDAVTVMTMHSTKGLQYDVVFLLGMDEGIMPDPAQDINEQRRLCYVAMTRARKELFLCHAKVRKGPPAKGWSFFNPSRFLNEIPREHKERILNY